MRTAKLFLLTTLSAALAASSAWADDVADVYAANRSYEVAFSSLDLNAIDAAWAHDKDVTAIHPRSKTVLIGWDAVRKSYADEPARQLTVAMENPHITIFNNTALVVGIEKVHTISTTGQEADFSVMATHVYEKRDGRWLLVHHHGGRISQ